MIPAWKKYDSVKDLPSSLWDNLISAGEVGLDSRLIRVAERIFPEIRFEFWVKENKGNVSGLIQWMIEENTVSTGTPETTGLHFWFDEHFISREQFLFEILQIKGERDKSIVFRDFIGEKADKWKALFTGAGFTPQRVLDLSYLTIPDQITSLEEYASVLNAKRRYRWNQYRKALDRNLYEVETVTNYLSILDELYPLYVEVSERAKEYAAEPYTKDYFRIVKEEFGDDAVTVTIREKSTGRYLGFMLLLYGKESCVHQYVGFHKRDELFLWHNLTIESIGDAIPRNIRRINMGVTHAAAKRKFGAINNEVFIFTKKEADDE